MKNRMKPLKRTIFWGIISLAAYLLILLNQQAVTQYCARGGLSALVVIGAALLFYLLAGAFADSLGEAAGLRAGKKFGGED